MAETIDRDVALTVWTRRFSKMVDAGVSLVRCLKSLEEEPTSGELIEATRTLRAKVEAGDTLSDAMRARRDLFGDEYVSAVRMGEVGGVLQTALQFLVARAARGPLVRTYPTDAPPTRADLAEWFWWFGKMLEAGVPLLSAVETLSHLGHPQLRDIAGQMYVEICAGFSLAPMSPQEEAPEAPKPVIWRYPGLFTPTVRLLVGFSVWFGPLAPRLLEVADLLEGEGALEAAGKLPPLSAAPTELPAPATSEAEHPVIRQVNDLIITMFKSAADWVDVHPTEGARGEAVLTQRSGKTLSTVALDYYPQTVRRIKLLAGLDPLTPTEGEGARPYRDAQIQVRFGGQSHVVHVRTGADRLALSPRKDAVEL